MFYFITMDGVAKFFYMVVEVGSSAKSHKLVSEFTEMVTCDGGWDWTIIRCER